MSPAARCYKARAKHTSSRELVQTSTRASNGNDIQVLGTRVIGAVDHSTHRETERHSELVSESPMKIGQDIKIYKQEAA